MKMHAQYKNKYSLTGMSFMEDGLIASWRIKKRIIVDFVPPPGKKMTHVNLVSPSPFLGQFRPPSLQGEPPRFKGEPPSSMMSIRASTLHDEHPSLQGSRVSLHPPWWASTPGWASKVRGWTSTLHDDPPLQSEPPRFDGEPPRSMIILQSRVSLQGSMVNLHAPW